MKHHLIIGKFKFAAFLVLALVVAMASAMPTFSASAQTATDSTLTVDLSGTWLSAVTVQLWSSDGGTLLWSQNNQHGATRTYSVTPGTYDVKLVQGPKTYVADDLDCNSDCSIGDVTAALSVDLSGSWLSAVTVQLFKDGSQVWSTNNQHGAVRTYNVLKDTYELKLVQGTNTKTIAVDCNADTCDAGDFVADLTLDLSGSWLSAVTVQLIKDGSQIWSANNQHGALRSYKVLKSTYDLKLVQGPQTYELTGIECNNETCDAGFVKETLDVDLSGTWLSAVTVQLFQNDGDLIWSTNNQHGALRTYNVLPATYDLKLVQGPKMLDIADVNCAAGGTCDAGDFAADLKVDLSGTWLSAVTVQLLTEDGGLVWSTNNQHGAERHYNVLKNTYDLKLVQGPKSLDIPNIVCTAETCDAGDFTEDLTVDLSGTWHSAVTVQLLTEDGGLVWSTNNQHGAERHYNVLKNDYDLNLVQGPKVLPIEEIACNGGACNAGDFTAMLDIDLSGSWPASITVALHKDDGLTGSVGERIWSTNNQHGALRSYNVLKNSYDVQLTMGGQSFIWDAVNCYEENCTLDKSSLTVDFPGISSVHVYVYPSDGTNGSVSGSLVASQTYKSNQAVFSGLDNGKYDVKVVKGAQTLIVDDVIVLGGNANAGDIVAEMTVKFPGISSVHSYVKVNDGVANTAAGGNVESRTYKSNETSMNVLKSTYDVLVVKGAQSYIVDALDCTGETCVVENIVAEMTVKFPGISSVHSYVKVNDGVANTAAGGNVESRTYKSNETSMSVLKSTYDVVVVKGAQSLIVDAVDCSNGDCTVDGIVNTLTVDFPGISSVHAYVKVDDSTANAAGGGNVESRTYKSNNTSMAVLKAFYDVVVVKSAKTKIIDSVDCTQAATCKVDGIVATLTVNFDGISSVHTYVKIDDGTDNSAVGGNVESRTYKTDQATMNVLKSTYDVVMVKGAKTKIVDSVDCNGDTCTVEDITALLTVKFPGFSSVHTYVKVNDGLPGSATGGNVESRTYKSNETSMTVLRNTYDVVLNVKGKTYIWDAVDCTGATCTLDESELIVAFPGISSAHVYLYKSNGIDGTVSGSTVASQSYKNDQAVFPGLDVGTYDIRVVKGAKTLIVDDVVVLGGSVRVDDIVATLTVNFPGISSVHTYVRVDDGSTGTAGGGDVDSATYRNDGTTIAVFKGTYDVLVKKNAQNKVMDAVDCTGDTCTVDGIVATLTVKFPGISSVHTYVRVDDGSTGTAGGGDVDSATYKNDETSIVVLKGTYDVMVKKNAQNKVMDAVDCTSDTCTVDGIVATLTVNFPGISDVHTYVRVDDGSTGTAGGGDVDSATYRNDGTTIAVLKGTYDVLVKKNAQNKVMDAVDCTGDTCTVDGIVATLTVKFPGISSVHTYVKVDDGAGGTATGGDVDSTSYKNDETSIVVLKGTYDVMVKKNAKNKIIDSVDCTGDTCVVDNIVATLTVEFPGLTGVHVYVRTTDGQIGQAGGGDVDSRTYQNNSTAIVVLKNYYDVVLKWGSNTGIADAVNCTGNTCALANTALSIAAPDDSWAQIVNVNTGSVVSSGNVGWDDLYEIALPIGLYDVTVKQTTGNLAASYTTRVFHFGGTTLDLKQNIHVDGPKSIAVNIYTSAGVLVKGASNIGSDGETDFEVIPDVYTLEFLQGVGTYTVTGVDVTTTDQSVDGQCDLRVNTANGADAHIYLPGTTDVVVETSNVGSDGWALFEVIKGTYDVDSVGVTQPNIDCTGETQTVNFP